MSFRAPTQLCSTITALALAGVAYAQPGDSNIAPDNAAPAKTTDEQALPVCPPDQATGQPLPACPPAPPPPAVPPPAPAPVAHEHHHNRIFAPTEVSITTGAGVANYFGSADSPTTVDPGAAWDARLTVGTRSVLALEAAYMGAVNNVDVATGGHGQLFSNGIDGDLRLQLPTVVEPYIFGGVGYNHMEVRNQGTGMAGNFAGSDDQVTVPAGGGVTAYVGHHVTIDARGTYRFIPDNGITVMTDRHLHQWLAQAHVGYAF